MNPEIFDLSATADHDRNVDLRSASSVLVVEDEALIALDLQNTLQDLGYRDVYRCADGPTAESLAEEHLPDVALMDIKIEGAQDGVETAEHICSNQGIPVVFLTAHTDRTTIRRALSISPYGYLVKPWSRTELDSTLQTAITRHRSERVVRARERHFRTIFEQSLIPIMIYDAAGRLIDANREAAMFFGAESFEALKGRTLVDEPFFDPRATGGGYPTESLRYDTTIDRPRPSQTSADGGAVRVVDVGITIIESERYSGDLEYMVQLVEHRANR